MPKYTCPKSGSCLDIKKAQTTVLPGLSEESLKEKTSEEQMSCEQVTSELFEAERMIL